MLREGIAAMLTTEPAVEVVGSAGSAEQGLEAFRTLQPDVTLMDLQMPGMGGLKGIHAIRESWPWAKVVVLTTYRGDANAHEALAAGAAGYLLKSALRSELIRCIYKVHSGGRYISADVCADIATHAGDERLTAREQRVLELIAGGFENKRIASLLSLSTETVKSHLRALFDKLGARNRSDAIRIGMRRGMLRDLDR